MGVRLPLPSPSDIIGLPAAVVESIVAFGDALSRAEALLPGAEDIVTRAQASLDQAAPAVARAAPAVPRLIDTASRVLQQVADVLTPERLAHSVRSSAGSTARRHLIAWRGLRTRSTRCSRGPTCWPAPSTPQTSS